MAPNVRTLRFLFLSLFIFACVIAAGVFTVQNQETVVIRFWDWSTRQLPEAMVLFVTFSIGVLFAGFFFMVEVFRVRGQLRRARRMSEMLEREVDALRNQPLFDEVPIVPPAPDSNSFDQRLSYDGQPEASVDAIEPKRAR